MANWTYHKYAERDPAMLKLMQERGMRNTLLLTNEGQAIVMDADTDSRVALVDMHTPCKRGERWKAECPIRERNARLIASAPKMQKLLMAWMHKKPLDTGEVFRLMAYIENGEEK